MPKIKKKDADRKRKLLKWFRSKKGQESLKNVQDEVMLDPYGRPISVMLPEAEVYGTPTQYEERDLAADVLRGGALAAREVGGLVPFLGEALDVAELEKVYRTGKDYYGDEANPAVYAGVTAGGLLLPNIIERPAKGAFRILKKGLQKLKEAGPKVLKKAADATPTKTASVITDTDTAPLPIYEPNDKVTKGLPTLKDQSGTQFVRDWYTRPEVRQHFRDVSGAKPSGVSASSRALSEEAYGDFITAYNRQLDFVEVGNTGNYKVVSNDPVISDLADKLNNIKPGDPSGASKAAAINKQIDSRRAEINETLIKELEEKYGKEVIDPMRREGGHLFPIPEDPLNALEDVFYRGRTAPDMLADYMTNPRLVPENAGGVMVPGQGMHKGVSAVRVLGEEGEELLGGQARREWLKSASAHESNHFANYTFISSNNPAAQELREGMASAVKPELKDHVKSGAYGASEGLETGVYGLEYYGSASELTARAMEMRRNVAEGVSNIATKSPSSLSYTEKEVLEAFNGKAPTEDQVLDFILGRDHNLTSRQERVLTDMAIKREALPKGSLLHVYNNVLDGEVGTKKKRDAFKNLMKFSLATGVAATAYGSMEGGSQPSGSMSQGGKFKVNKKAKAGMRVKKDPTKGKPNPMFFGTFPDEPSDSLDVGALRRGIAQAESLGGVLMMNPTSSATGLYGQLYNEIKDLPFMKGVSREDFAESKDLQDKAFDMRVEEGIGAPSLRRNAIELTEEYAPQLGDKWEYSLNDVAALTNLLGRQGTREFFASKRDGTEYKVPGVNKTPEEYLSIVREASKKK